MEIFNQLKNDTLFTVEKLTVDRKYIKDLEFKRSEAIERATNTVDSTGINQLTRLFNKLELESICNDYLQVEHKAGNNPHSKVVLTKRLGESLEREGLEKWFKKCKDVEILRTFAAALGITAVPKEEAKAISYIQKEAPFIIRRFGFQVILNRLETEELHQICQDMKLRKHTNTNSRRALITAIVNQTDVVVPEPVERRKSIAKKPTKKAIEKCTEYEQLFQHYFLDQLVDWCRENGLKTSGNKKVIINRILAYLGGDKENTMADETRVRRSIKRRSAVPEDEDDEEGENEEEEEEQQQEVEEEEEEEVKPKKGLSDRSKKEVKKTEKKPVVKQTKKTTTKKTTTKKAPKVEEEVEEEVEEDEEQMTVDAERELRTTESDQEEEEQEQDVNQSSEAEEETQEDESDGIDGVTFCLTGHMSAKRDVIVKAIVAAGGKVCATVTKEVTVLVAEDPDAKSAKLEKAREDGVKVVGEDYLKKYIEY